jgi:dTDP-4-dehydrorhamnose 3,5-epimerase
MRILVLGAGGQVGRALARALPDAVALTREQCDITTPPDLAGVDVVINAAAFTAVDAAETAPGRAEAWRANAAGPAALAAAAARSGCTLVHLSTEYVFDGTWPGPTPPDAPVAPLGAYGASKAAGDLAVAAVPRHYLVRPTWVVGDGRNFVRTMLGLAARGVAPTVVDDQFGRLTFADDLAGAIVHLLDSGAEPGTYQVTGSGEPASWADVAREVYAQAGCAHLPVTGTSSEAYFADKPHAARRPLNSVLDLGRAAQAGVVLPDWRERLADYVRRSKLAATSMTY